MSIFDIIRKDCQHLEYLIEKLSDGGGSFMPSWQEGIDSNVAKLTSLKAILNSGIIPTSYTSIITKKTYYPTPQELKDAKPLPTATHSFFCAKRSRKASNKYSQSRFELYDTNSNQLLYFFVEHKTNSSYPDGGYAGKVKQAYSIADEKSPKYALKVFKKNQFGKDTMHELRTAMRGAYCSRILGRTGYAFRRNGKQYLLSDWLSGTTLNKVDKNKMTAMPIPKRINLVQNLLAEIGLLHQYGIIHCDIKPGNIMFNGDSLHIFDFDGARLENEKIATTNVGPLFTNRFLDDQLNWDIDKNYSNYYQKFNVKSDIYALGLTLASVFPDIINPIYEKKIVTVNGGPQTFEFDSITLKYGTEYNKHKPLGELLIKLVKQNPDHRPGSINEIANDLSKILQNQYEEKLQTTYISMTTGLVQKSFNGIASILKPFKESFFSTKSNSNSNMGRDAFLEIESELESFNTRNGIFMENFRKVSSAQEENDKRENSSMTPVDESKHEFSNDSAMTDIEEDSKPTKKNPTKQKNSNNSSLFAKGQKRKANSKNTDEPETYKQPFKKLKVNR